MIQDDVEDLLFEHLRPIREWFILEEGNMHHTLTADEIVKLSEKIMILKNK